MQFSDTTNKLGLVEEVDFVLGTNSTSYPLADKTRSINDWYYRVVTLILKSDNRWEWDDNNKSDEAIYTTNLTANTQSYAITGATFLKILKLEIKDNSSNWQPIFPISIDDKRMVTLTDYQKTAGTPKEYDKIGNKIYLYPKPNYTSTNGLKIYYQRNPDLFASTDTTKVPGFAANFHRILSYGAAYDYCLAYDLFNKMPAIKNEIDKLEAALIEHYSDRGRDDKMSMKLRSEDYGSDEFTTDYPPTMMGS